MAVRYAVPYAEASYWDRRYRQQGAVYEWFCDFDMLRPLLCKFVPKKKQCLHVGCGTSKLQNHLAKSGYNIVNIDVAETLLNSLRDENSEHTNMSYVLCDVREMTQFNDCRFGSAIDKGTLDALLCSSEGLKNVDRMLSEISRTLSPTGVFFLVSLGEPCQRLHLLANPKYGWDLKFYLIPKPGFEDKLPSNHRLLQRTQEGKSWYVGPFNSLEQLPEPWDPKPFFFCYLCRKHPLVLPSSKDSCAKEKAMLPESWRKAAKELVEQLKQQGALPYGSTHKGLRCRRVNLAAYMAQVKEKEMLVSSEESSDSIA